MADPFDTEDDEDDAQYAYAPDSSDQGDQGDVFGQDEIDSILADDVANPANDAARQQATDEGDLVTEADMGTDEGDLVTEADMGTDPIVADAQATAIQDVADQRSSELSIFDGAAKAPITGRADPTLTEDEQRQQTAAMLRDVTALDDALKVQLVDEKGKPLQNPRITRGGQPIRGITEYGAVPQLNAQPKAATIPSIQQLNPQLFGNVDLSKREASPENAAKYDQLDFIGWLGGKGQMAAYTSGDNKVRTALTNSYLQARMGANIPGYGRGRRLSPEDRAYEQEVKANVLGINRMRVRGFTPEINRPELLGDTPEITLKNVASHPIWQSPLMRERVEKGDSKEVEKLLGAFLKESVPKNAKAAAELEAVKQKLLGDRKLWLRGGVDEPKEGDPKVKETEGQNWLRYFADAGVGAVTGTASLAMSGIGLAGAGLVWLAGSDKASTIMAETDKAVDEYRKSLPLAAGEGLQDAARSATEFFDKVKRALVSDPYLKRGDTNAKAREEVIKDDKLGLFGKIQGLITNTSVLELPEMIGGSLGGVGLAAKGGRTLGALMGLGEKGVANAGRLSIAAAVGGSEGTQRLQELLPNKDTLEYKNKFEAFKKSEYSKAGAEDALKNGYVYDAEVDFENHARRFASQSALVGAVVGYATMRMFGGADELFASGKTAAGTLAQRVGKVAAGEGAQETLEAYLNGTMEKLQDLQIAELNKTGDVDKFMRAMTSAEVQAKALFEGTIGALSGASLGAASRSKTPTQPKDPNATPPVDNPGQVQPPAATTASANSTSPAAPAAQPPVPNTVTPTAAAGTQPTPFQAQSAGIATRLAALSPEAQTAYARDKVSVDKVLQAQGFTTPVEKQGAAVAIEQQLLGLYETGDYDAALDGVLESKGYKKQRTPKEKVWKTVVDELVAARNARTAAVTAAQKAALPDVDAEIASLLGKSFTSVGKVDDNDKVAHADITSLDDLARAAISRKLKDADLSRPESVRKAVTNAAALLRNDDGRVLPKEGKGTKSYAAVLFRDLVGEVRAIRRANAESQAKAVSPNAAKTVEELVAKRATAQGGKKRGLQALIGQGPKGASAEPELPPLTPAEASTLPEPTFADLVKDPPEAKRPPVGGARAKGKRTGQNNQSPLAAQPFSFDAAKQISAAAVQAADAIDARVRQKNPNHVPVQVDVVFFGDDAHATAMNDHHGYGLWSSTFSTFSAVVEDTDAAGNPYERNTIFVNLARVADGKQLEDELRAKIITSWRLGHLASEDGVRQLRDNIVSTAMKTAEGRKIWADVQKSYRDNGHDPDHPDFHTRTASSYFAKLAALDRPLNKSFWERMRDWVNNLFGRFYSYGEEFSSDDLQQLFKDFENAEPTRLVDRAKAISTKLDTQKKRPRDQELYATASLGDRLSAAYNDSEFVEQAFRDAVQKNPGRETWGQHALRLVTTRHSTIAQRLITNADPLKNELQTEIAKLAKAQGLTIEETFRSLNDVAVARRLKNSILRPDSTHAFLQYRYTKGDAAEIRRINKYYQEQLAADPSRANQEALGEAYRQELEVFARNNGVPPKVLSYMGMTLADVDAFLVGSRNVADYAAAIAVIDKIAARSRENLIANGTLSAFEVAFYNDKHYVPMRGTRAGFSEITDKSIRSAKPRGQTTHQIVGRKTLVENSVAQLLQDLYASETGRVDSEIYRLMSELADIDANVGTNEDHAPVQLGPKALGKAAQPDRFGVHMGFPVDASRPYFRLPDGKIRSLKVRRMQLVRMFDPTNISIRGNVTGPDGQSDVWAPHKALGKLEDPSRKFSSFMGAVQTVWNQAFWATGHWRDVSLIGKHAGTRAVGDGGLTRAGWAQAVKTYGNRNNWVAIGKYAAADGPGRQAFLQSLPQNSPVRRWIEQGGYHDATAQFNAQALGEDIKRAVRTGKLEDMLNGYNKTKAAGQVLKSIVEGFTSTLDNVARLAYYEGMLASGTNPDKSLRLAVETMNWSQTSDAARTFGVVYPFAKAKATGQYQLLRREIWRKGEAPLVSRMGPDGKIRRELREDWVKEINWPLMVMNTVPWALAVGLAAAFMWDDKNKPSAKELATKAVMPFSVAGKPVMMPFQLGADRLSGGTAQLLAAAAVGVITPKEAVSEIAASLVGELLPGPTIMLPDDTAPRSTLTSTLVGSTPIALQWAMELATNTTVFGGEVYREDPFKRTTPAGSHRLNTPDAYKDIARMANSVGINLHPDMIGHLLQKTGTVGQTLDAALKAWVTGQSGGELLAKVAGLNRFQSQAGKYNALNEVRKFELEQIDPYRRRKNELARINDTAGLAALRQRYPNWQAIEAYVTRDAALKRTETELRKQFARKERSYRDVETLYDKNNDERLRLRTRVLGN